MPHRPFLQLSVPRSLPAWQVVLVGGGAWLVCVALRALLDYAIPERLTSITFFPGLVVATYIAGAMAGAIVLGGALVSWLLGAVPTVALVRRAQEWRRRAAIRLCDR